MKNFVITGYATRDNGKRKRLACIVRARSAKEAARQVYGIFETIQNIYVTFELREVA